MVISCFRGTRRTSDALDPEPVPARQVAPKKRSTFQLRRVATNTSSVASSSRTSSNASIAQLPPCPHLNDPEIDAMMMPVPTDPKPPKCLRLSYPKIYGNIVTDMKEAKGCRDWRNFSVFDDNDVDMSVSADEYAQKKAQEYKKRMDTLSSF